MSAEIGGMKIDKRVFLPSWFIGVQLSNVKQMYQNLWGDAEKFIP